MSAIGTNQGLNVKLWFYDVFSYQGKGKNLKGQLLITISKNKDHKLASYVRYFAKNKNSKAIQEYGHLEDDPKFDVVVLVSVKNIVDIQKAFPNYYADAELFIEFSVKQKIVLLKELRELNT